MAICKASAATSVTESDSGPAPEIDSEQSLETDSELVSEQYSEPLSTLESSASDSKSEQELSIMKETQIY